MKIIVKPVKSFMLLLPFAEEMQASRPSVVSTSEYLTDFITKGQVRVLVQQDVPEEANDKDFAKLWTEVQADKDSKLDAQGKEEFVIESYLSTLKKTVEEKAAQEKAEEKKAAEAAAKNGKQ